MVLTCNHNTAGMGVLTGYRPETLHTTVQQPCIFQEGVIVYVSANYWFQHAGPGGATRHSGKDSQANQIKMIIQNVFN